MAGCQAVFRAETTSELEDERLGQLCVVAPWPDVTKLRPELLKLNAHIASWTRSGVRSGENKVLFLQPRRTVAQSNALMHHLLDEHELRGPFRRRLGGCMWVEHTGATFDEVVCAALRPVPPQPDFRLRLQIFPRKLQANYTSVSADSGQPDVFEESGWASLFSPVDYTHKLFVLYDRSTNLFHAGLVNCPQQHCQNTVSTAHVLTGAIHSWPLSPPNGLGVVCRAQHKASEAMVRWQRAFPDHAQPWLGGRCLDIGAAPGGWTATFAEAGADLVVAVDSGDLDSRLLAAQADKIWHRPCLLETALPDLKTLVSSGAVGDRHLNPGGFNLVACDTNTPAQQTVAMVESLIAHNLLAATGCAVILTIKHFKGDERTRKAAEGRLHEIFSPTVTTHLFSNSPREHTIMAWWPTTVELC